MGGMQADQTTDSTRGPPHDEVLDQASRCASRSISRTVLYAQLFGAVGQALACHVEIPEPGRTPSWEHFIIVSAYFGALTMIVCPITALLINISHFVEDRDAGWLLLLSWGLAAIQYIAPLPAI